MAKKMTCGFLPAEVREFGGSVITIATKRFSYFKGAIFPPRCRPTLFTPFPPSPYLSPSHSPITDSISVVCPWGQKGGKAGGLRTRLDLEGLGKERGLDLSP